ncbi:GDSL-type esterase/lipase family protein [Shewanella indica]|uniref:GDSL-type esterase/lipase family protein n=1 Tax=Shewanella indica TaxID=768528 RepID=UPI00399A0A92
MGAKAGHDYPSRLAELCRCEVINAGISGEQSAAGLERLPALLDETKPDLLILLEGGNDILRGRSQAQLTQNIETMLLEAKERQIPVVLLAVPQKSLLLSPLPLYAELADKHGAILLEDTLSELLRSNELKSDNVHLNQQGYLRLAQIIFSKLQEAGAF